MRLIVSVDDVGGTFYANMQEESDEAWEADPEDGAGSLSIGTPGTAANARILAIETGDNQFGWLSGNKDEETARTLAQAAGLLAEQDQSTQAREAVMYLTGAASRLLRRAQVLDGTVEPPPEPGSGQ